MQERVCAVEKQRRKIERKYGQPASQVIEDLKNDLGSFSAAAEELETSPTSLRRLRTHLGMPIKTNVPLETRIAAIEKAYKRPAAETITALKTEKENWELVAEELNIPPNTLFRIRDALGMPLTYVSLDKRIKEIERVYGRPAKEVFLDFRDPEQGVDDGGNPLHTIADCFKMSRTQLNKLREVLDIPPDGMRIYSPASFGPTPTDEKAIDLGHENGEDAVAYLKLVKGLTVKQGAAELGVSITTFKRYTRPEIQGHPNLSEKGREVLVRSGQEVGSRPPNDNHPWKQHSVVKR